MGRATFSPIICAPRPPQAAVLLEHSDAQALWHKTIEAQFNLLGSAQEIE